MKQFTIQKISTDSDGTVILIGKKGFLRVRRENNNYSGAAFSTNYINNEGAHHIKITEIPTDGNIAF